MIKLIENIYLIKQFKQGLYNVIVHAIPLFVAVFITFYDSNAQGDLPTETASMDSLDLFHSRIHVQAKPMGDSIVLRWATDKPGAWVWANLKGYYIERIKMSKDSLFLKSNLVKVNPQPIKAWPLNDWEKVVNPKSDSPNQYAAIAAQMLYGKGYSSPDLFDQANEFENRFSFALLAADISPVTADALGLRYVDKNIEKDAVYIYKVYVSELSESYKIDTGAVFVNSAYIPENPQVLATSVLEQENYVAFLWDRKLYDSHYSAYYIERSDDQKNYVRLTKQPFINPISNDFKENKEFIVFSDSLEQNYKPYYYRIIGISPFGDTSEPSIPIRAMGKDKTPPIPPTAISAEYLGGTKVKVSWSKDVKEPDLKGFLIGRSQNAGDGFEPLFNDPLPPGQNSYVDESALSNGTNYYLVAAVDTAGNGSSSIVSYAMIIDSLPPLPPKNIKGHIDSTGVVTITWDKGTEQDLAGYMVYFSNDKSHVFSTLNNYPIQDTVFTDTIQIKTLTEDIYYTMKSLDVNYNYSSPSDTLKLLKPDIIPPTSPVFTNFQVSELGIQLTWTPTSSTDAVKYLLFRKTDSEKDNLLTEISVIPGLPTQYLDSSVVEKELYEYTLYTIDDANLSSIASTPLKVKMGDFSKVPPVKNLSYSIDQETGILNLSWKYNESGNHRYLLYKAVDGGMFQTYKMLDGTINNFEVKNIEKNKVYEFVIKVQIKNGKSSSFGNIIKVVD